MARLSAVGAAAIGTPGLALAAGTTIRLDRLTVDDFVDRLGTKFVIHDQSHGAVKADLVEAKPSKYPAPDRCRRAFSIVFRLPQGVPMTQDVYAVTQFGLGSMRLLLTPIGPAGEENRVEAVFG